MSQTGATPPQGETSSSECSSREHHEYQGLRILTTRKRVNDALVVTTGLLLSLAAVLWLNFYAVMSAAIESVPGANWLDAFEFHDPEFVEEFWSSASLAVDPWIALQWLEFWDFIGFSFSCLLALWLWHGARSQSELSPRFHALCFYPMIAAVGLIPAWILRAFGVLREYGIGSSLAVAAVTGEAVAVAFVGALLSVCLGLHFFWRSYRDNLENRARPTDRSPQETERS